MIIELKTFRAICDECGHQHQFVSDKLKYPLLWGKTTRSEHVGTRMEDSKYFLCPYCTAAVQYGSKYSEELLEIF